MKGFAAHFGLITVCLILHLFHVSAQSSPFDENSNAITKEPSQGTPSLAPPIKAGGGSSNVNTTEPFFTMDNMGINDPTVRQYLTMVYGSLIGRPECVKKSICMAGNYLSGTPGSDFFFMMADRYIPTSFRAMYSILRDSVLYGVDCNVYVCTQQPSNNPR